MQCSKGLQQILFRGIFLMPALRLYRVLIYYLLYNDYRMHWVSNLMCDILICSLICIMGIAWESSSFGRAGLKHSMKFSVSSRMLVYVQPRACTFFWNLTKFWVLPDLLGLTWGTAVASKDRLSNHQTSPGPRHSMILPWVTSEGGCQGGQVWSDDKIGCDWLHWMLIVGLGNYGEWH